MNVLTPVCDCCGQPISVDARAVSWRCRIYLYDAADDIRADSDDGLPLGAPGTLITVGLLGVAEALSFAASQYHNQETVGLDEATLRHRLKALRPTLSRRGGNAVWRVPYQVSGDGAARHWMARVDIERVASG